MTHDRASTALREIASRRAPAVETLVLARAHGRVLATAVAAPAVASNAAPLRAGCVLTPLRVAFAAECGIAAVEVARRPTVAVFEIGDTVEPGLPLTGGARHGGARELLVGLLRADGLEPTAWPRLPAEPQQVAVALRDAGCAFDAILVCGCDDALAQVREVLAAFGTPGSADRVAAARDAVFGTLDEACVLALPAEPLQLLGGYLTLGRDLLDGLQGRNDARPSWRGRMTAASVGAKYQLVRTRFDDLGVLQVEPVVEQDRAAASDADGLLVLHDAVAAPGEGALVEVIPLPGS